jgi:hypothetical protein
MMNELEHLERRMERRWFDLATAEQRGQPDHVLDRMYDAYVHALDEYVLFQRDSGRAARARIAS